MQTCLRPEDTVARLGGDEFAVLLDDLTGSNDPTRVAERIRQELARAVELDGQAVFPSASIGIAVGSGGYVRAEDLLRDADTALYRAKGLGRNRYEVFDAQMHAEAVAQLRLESELRQALDRGEFRLEYQPIVALDGGRIVGFEALLRWQHPVRGIVYPGDFLEVAEETGLIVPIGWWVLHEACAQVRQWQDHYAADPPWGASVNLGSRQFIQPDLTDRIEAVLNETGIEPRSLMIEITESVIMDNAEAVTQRLARLRELEIKLSIDDFGTGYSSLSYLQRFPIDMLKIDRSFVGQMGAGGENLEIVRTIVTLAHNLSKNVIAEGVETLEQLSHLRALHCDYVQGYYFSRTMDHAAATALLSRQAHLHR